MATTSTQLDPEKLRQLQLLGAAPLVPEAAPKTAPMPLSQPDAQGYRHGVHITEEAAKTHPALPTATTSPATAPDLGTTALPAIGAPGGKTAMLPALSFKERQALPTTSAGVAPGTSDFYQNKLERIEDQKANPYGSAENHSGILGKIGHVLAKVGNIAGDIAAPGTLANIPGTDLNRQQQERGAERGFETASNRENTAAIEKTREKHEENLEDVNQQKIDQKDTLAQRKEEADLRSKGFERDENGLIQPVAYERMSEPEKAKVDLQRSQDELAQARAEYERTKADPNSPQNKAALGRLQVAAQNASTAAGKLGLNTQEFAAKYLGMGPDNQPLAGVATDEKTGKPIGPSVANSSNTSADRLKRSDLARNVETNAASFKKLIQENPDLFGKIAGRFTTAQQMIGSDDPAIARAGVAVHNMALASNGAHGVRSQEAVRETENEILNHFRNGTEATMAAVDEIVNSVQTFREDANHGKRPNNTPAAGATPPAAPTEPPRPPKDGMKWQQNKKTGEFREVPIG